MLNTLILCPLILCPNARLVRSIKNDIARQQLQVGQHQWQSAPVLTLGQWLEDIIEAGLLGGDIATPQNLLSPLNEQLLWQEVITNTLKKNVFGELFDLAGLAAAAMEANRYVIAWQLHIPHEQQAEESRQFVQWQRAFQQRCSQLNVLESVRYFDWQLDCLSRSIGELPSRIEFAGFDQAAPQEQRLREILIQKNIEVAEYVSTRAEPALAQHARLENQEAEYRAAVAWAKRCLDENPQAKLAIITPQLNESRNQLADLLDDVFYPASVRPSLADVTRHYNFSLGTPLSQQPIIQAALNLLRLFSSYQLQQVDVSSMLLSPFWSASRQESDARALLDAKVRDKLPMQFSLLRLIEFTEKQHENDLNLSRLLADMRAATAISNKKASAAHIAQTLESLLSALNWPGERGLSSLEYQTINAWQKALQQLKKLDVLGKKLSLSEGAQLMQQICASQVFQAETEGESSIQILGIMEALSAPVDAMWVMHMNDHIWPPPARPNPLLPAFIQRIAHVPNADNNVQAAFAATIHQRLLHSAKTIIFSSSKTEGESQLRASPLMQDIASSEQNNTPSPNQGEGWGGGESHQAQKNSTTILTTILTPIPTFPLKRGRSSFISEPQQESSYGFPLAETLAETLSQQGNADLAQIEDHLAPIVQVGEHVSGGTGLLKAQAICPAWAFYQYRLGAKALKTPRNGLDSMERGSLVHAVLAAFWQPNKKQRHFADLRDMPESDLEQALNLAIRNSLRDFALENNIASKTALTLEHERLYKLVSDWLAHEKARNIAFHIVDCEAEQQVHICGIEITLKIDRIHQLENGGIEFIDYKTGQIPKMTSWGDARITEPQLPTYAAFWGAHATNADTEANEPIAGVHFGMVKIAEHTFEGVSEANFASEVDKRKPAFIQNFSDWPSLLKHWKSSIEAIAEEIKAGEAAVVFEDDNLLNYCEVVPLLRLPERQLQFERFQNPINESYAA
jgi:hypothetical protein